MAINKMWLSMRHFLTAEYRDNIYMGQQEYPICNTDITTHGLIENLSACTLFASPLKRSVQTVDFILNTYTDILFDVVYLDQLVERGLGDFEGKQKDSIRYDSEYFIDKKFIVTKTPPNGEGISEFRDRVEKAVEIMQAEYKERDVFIVSHLQTLRMIKFCFAKSYEYDKWHDVNYSHGEVVKESYG